MGYAFLCALSAFAVKWFSGFDFALNPKSRIGNPKLICGK
jgi:hypothetical protein